MPSAVGSSKTPVEHKHHVLFASVTGELNFVAPGVGGFEIRSYFINGHLRFSAQILFPPRWNLLYSHQLCTIIKADRIIVDTPAWRNNMIAKTILRAIALAMAVAVIVLALLNSIPAENNLILLGIGLFALALATFLK
jgi:hypothetical protein